MEIDFQVFSVSTIFACTKHLCGYNDLAILASAVKFAKLVPDKISNLKYTSNGSGTV